MLGIVGVENHKIHCIIGNNPEEQLQPQDIYVDIRVKVDFARCTHSDRLKDTVDYTRLAHICSELATTRRYRIIETFAAEVLQRLVQEFDIQWAWIRIKKPAALPSADYTYVELELHGEHSQ